MEQLELTIEVHREDDAYSVEITRADVWALQGRWTAARTLRELPDYLEDAIQVCLDDPGFRLLTRDLHPGTMQVTGTVSPEPDATR